MKNCIEWNVHWRKHVWFLSTNKIFFFAKIEFIFFKKIFCRQENFLKLNTHRQSDSWLIVALCEFFFYFVLRFFLFVPLFFANQIFVYKKTVEQWTILNLKKNVRIVSKNCHSTWHVSSETIKKHIAVENDHAQRRNADSERLFICAKWTRMDLTKSNLTLIPRIIAQLFTMFSNAIPTFSVKSEISFMFILCRRQTHAHTHNAAIFQFRFYLFMSLSPV